jgi:hypothetical protein
MDLSAYLQQQADTTNRLTQLLQPLADTTNRLTQLVLQQQTQLTALAEFAKHFDMSSPEAQHSSAVLLARRDDLAKRHAGVKARLSYILARAEKRGTATYFTVVRALDGDAESLETLQRCARNSSLAACVLALITELATLTEQVLHLVEQVAEAVTRAALHRFDFLDLAQPLVIREGTASPNGPPAAHHALSGTDQRCLAVTTSPLVRSTPT